MINLIMTYIAGLLLIQQPQQFTFTAYCPCEICCGKTDGITYTGVLAQSEHTIAVDPDIIPLGTEVMINGHIYKAEDIGGAIDGYHIDIFFDTHQEALNFGVQKGNVKIVTPLYKFIFLENRGGNL